MGRSAGLLAMGVLLGIVFPGWALTAEGAPSAEEVKALLTAGKYKEARPAAEALLAEMERAQGSESLEAARALDLVVEARLRLGLARQAETRTLAERALAIKERLLGPDDPDVAETLGIMGGLFALLRDAGNCRPSWERCHSIREKTLGPDHQQTGKSLAGIASCLNMVGDLEGAKEKYVQSIGILEKALGPDHTDLSSPLSNLAGTLIMAQDFASAFPLRRRTLAILEKSRGPDHPDTCLALNNMADLLYRIGDYAEARRFAERAVSCSETALGPNHASLATPLHTQAEVMMATGDLKGARPILERALAIREAALGPDHPSTAWILTNLGHVSVKMGDGAAGRSFHERSVAVSRKSLPPGHLDIGWALNSLAYTLRVTGDTAAALPLAEEALAIFRERFGAESLPVARATTNLAFMHVILGDVEKAGTLYETALAIRKGSALSHGGPEMAWITGGYAAVTADQGDFRKAFDLALETERLSRENLRVVGGGLPEQEALRYAVTFPRGLGIALSVLSAAPESGSGRRALDAMVRSRAVVLDEMAARSRAVGGSADPAVSALAQNHAAARARLASLVTRGSGEDQERYRAAVERARRESEEAERALAAASVESARLLAQTRTGVDEAASGLPRGSALVSFVRYEAIDFKPTVPGEGGRPALPFVKRGVPSFMAFVLHEGDSEPHVVSLGPAQPILDATSRWHEEAARGLFVPGRAPGAAERAVKEAGETLRSMIWDPLAAPLAGIERVFIVPDGGLNLVNFNALPAASAPDRYLVESSPILHYLSAERDLLPDDGRAEAGKGLLVVGGPAFDASGGPAVASSGQLSTGDPAAAMTMRSRPPACGGFADVMFEPLPETLRESREIAALWRNGPAGTSADILELEGSAATEAAFKRLAAGHDVIHLATHGFFLTGDCRSDPESTRGIGGLSAPPPPDKGPPAAIPDESPLLLSGLAFAGANHRGAAAPDAEDGILTAAEIASLNLHGVEWAVLSACETGVGEIQAGEGVVGLRRAFQVAGAATLISSLWSVEDKATRAWMTALYRARRERGEDTASSVRSASVEALKTRRAAGQSTHPFYWGAFVAAGDWR